MRMFHLVDYFLQHYWAFEDISPMNGSILAPIDGVVHKRRHPNAACFGTNLNGDIHARSRPKLLDRIRPMNL